MSRIVVHELTKTFQVAQRRPGLWGAVTGVFHRTFHEVRALDAISFTIEPGELVGYIGPNGAGKSTTVKVLSGILVPDRGTCQVGGLVPWNQRIEHVRRIGVVFGQRSQLWWDLPVAESLDLLCEVYRLEHSAYLRARGELVERLELGPLLDTPVRQLSLGQRMRCDLAAALLHCPDILFLDEPTIGLDAMSKLAVRDFVRHLNQDRGTTVILTTHDMDDIEALCDRVLVISDGRIACDGSLNDLRRQVNPQRRLIVDLVQEGETIQDEAARVVQRDGHRVHLEFDPATISPSSLIARVTARHAIRDLFVENPPIEQIIAQLYALRNDEERT